MLIITSLRLFPSGAITETAVMLVINRWAAFYVVQQPIIEQIGLTITYESRAFKYLKKLQDGMEEIKDTQEETARTFQYKVSTR